VVRYAAKADGDLWLLSLDGRSERPLTTLHTWFNGLTFTSTGKEIVFSAVEAHHSRLHRVSVDGTGLTRIPAAGTADPVAPCAGAGCLVFEDTAYTSRIYRGSIRDGMVVDHRLFTPLTQAAEFLCYSHDGSKIAWSQFDGIWAVEPGAQPHLVTAISEGKSDLACSPDACYFAITVQSGTEQRIWIVDARTGGKTRLTNDDAVEGRPVWSPPGTYIYWRSARLGEARFFRRKWPDGPPEPVSPPPTKDSPVRMIACSTIWRTASDRAFMSPSSAASGSPACWKMFRR
jgi:Tol biopolymer transport system component